ncbi:hypothetical protein Tco_1277496, partial [Tanacetum coccineum]
DEAQAIIADKPKRLRKKRKVADGVSSSGLPPKKLREDHGVSRDAGDGTAEKSLDVLQGLLDRSTLATEIGATSAATVPFVTSSMTPTPEREGVLTDSSHHSSIYAADDEVTSIVRSSIPPPLVLTAVVATTIIADVTSASAPRASTRQLRSMDYEQLFAQFNVGMARQSCLGSEVRLQLEHELREAEAAEAIRLRSQVSVVEATKAARASKLNGLKERNAALEGQLSCDELSFKASSLEFEKDKLVDQVSKLEGTCFELCDEVSGNKLFKEHIKVVQDVQVKVISDRVA